MALQGPPAGGGGPAKPLSCCLGVEKGEIQASHPRTTPTGQPVQGRIPYSRHFFSASSLRPDVARKSWEAGNGLKHGQLSLEFIEHLLGAQPCGRAHALGGYWKCNWVDDSGGILPRVPLDFTAGSRSIHPRVTMGRTEAEPRQNTGRERDTGVGGGVSLSLELLPCKMDSFIAAVCIDVRIGAKAKRWEIWAGTSTASWTDVPQSMLLVSEG